MTDIEKIEAKIQMEQELIDYGGSDKVILADEKFDEIKSLRENRPAFHAGTGIPGLEDCTDGFRPGQLVIVSGPPKQGKTLLCQNFTMRFQTEGHKCLWLEWELGYEEFFEKFPKLKSLTFDFYVPNTMEVGDLGWVEKRIVESKLKYGTDIVFLDHLDFLKDFNIIKNVSSNYASYVGGIIQKVKSMAVRHNVLIFLMCHIAKGNWTTNDLPTSQDLRDSGQIAQLADIVMMVIRRRASKGSMEVYDGNKAMVGVIENRHNGKTKKVDVEMHNQEIIEIFNAYTAPEADTAVSWWKFPRRLIPNSVKPWMSIDILWFGN